jgi:multidrug efflux system outer membrane protein
VASAYLQLRSLDTQLDLARQTLNSRQQSVQLMRTLESHGSIPLSDLRQAEVLLYNASSAVPRMEQQVQQTENALQLLLGKAPGKLTHLDPKALDAPPVTVPVGLPSQLLERRPDIQQVEAQLRAANAQIGIARAHFFPQISLSATEGVGGSSLASFADPASAAGYALGQLVQPIFAGGRIRGQYELSRRQKEEMLLNYQSTILTSLHDVSNALIALRKQRATREEEEKLVHATKDTAQLASLRYQAGAASYLEVLTAETNLFDAQLTYVRAQQNESTALVQLYAALGGGWK